MRTITLAPGSPNHVSTRFQQLLEAKRASATEWVALRTLWACDETCHAELILALAMTKGAASTVVSRLEVKGLAQRQFASANARHHSLALTPLGKAMVPLLAAMAGAHDDHCLGHFDAQKRQVLMTSMRALVQHHQPKDIPSA